MVKITLFQFNSDSISVDIEAYFDGEDLVVEGYDIGKTVEDCWGDSDYEYSTTVEAKDVERLYPLLGVARGDREGLLKAIADRFNTNSCYSEFNDLLEKNGIPSRGFSWT